MGALYFNINNIFFHKRAFLIRFRICERWERVCVETSVDLSLKVEKGFAYFSNNNGILYYINKQSCNM